MRIERTEKFRADVVSQFLWYEEKAGLAFSTARVTFRDDYPMAEGTPLANILKCAARAIIFEPRL